MGGAGFKGIRKLVTRRQNKIEQYILMQPILDLFERASWRPGAKVSWRWWDQASIELEGAKKQEAEAATVSKSESES